MIRKPFKDTQLSYLGLGNMRLPLVDANDNKSGIDYPRAHEVIDAAYKAGINYFDTAYIYNGGDSERCLGACMEKYPRDSFYLADKFNIDANPDYEAVFEEQLKRLRTDHIDFYLLHCLLDSNADEYLQSGCIEYFEEQRRKGRISYLGFSSHACPAVLRAFACRHKWDFAQIQLNYFDWRYGSAAEEYRILASMNIPIMVMEPVRGGRLATLCDEARLILNGLHPEWSVPEWAFRFVKSLEGIQVVLSGMGNTAQLQDNLETFSDAEGLSREEFDALMRACEVYRKHLQVPCTGCRYCTAGCPAEINIPEYLRAYNVYRVDESRGMEMLKTVSSKGKPVDCLGCGNCIGHCPQSINTPTLMKALAELMALEEE